MGDEAEEKWELIPLLLPSLKGIHLSNLQGFAWALEIIIQVYLGMVPLQADCPSPVADHVEDLHLTLPGQSHPAEGGKR